MQGGGGLRQQSHTQHLLVTTAGIAGPHKSQRATRGPRARSWLTSAAPLAISSAALTPAAWAASAASFAASAACCAASVTASAASSIASPIASPMSGIEGNLGIDGSFGIEGSLGRLGFGNLIPKARFGSVRAALRVFYGVQQCG